MPKKSRKEKILADLRRSASPTFTFQMKKEAATPVRGQRHENTTELTAIKRDLYKTFMLATLAIAVEVIIYWFRR